MIEITVAFLIVLFTNFLAYFIDGYVFLRLFNWFVAPALNVEPISYGLAVGTIITISLLLRGVAQREHTDVNTVEESVAHIGVFMVIAPLLFLGMGAVIHWLLV